MAIIRMIASNRLRLLAAEAVSAFRFRADVWADMAIPPRVNLD
jgi:hypothetical protein